MEIQDCVRLLRHMLEHNTEHTAEMLEMENGTTTQGYTGKSRTENAISPSTRDLSDGVSSISFTYLSPGYYALVNNDSMETYIIKITK